jgi:hypothetical protein
MMAPAPATWLADALVPLGAAFGGRVRFSRDGGTARWSYDGQAAEVRMRSDDRIAARFVGAPAFDAVTGTFVTPVYERYASGYAMDRAGCERMVADMAAFFSGIREPRFTFVSA